MRTNYLLKLKMIQTQAFFGSQIMICLFPSLHTHMHVHKCVYTQIHTHVCKIYNTIQI